VDQGKSELLLSQSLLTSDASWIGKAPAGLADGYRCSAKIRYRQDDQACTVESGRRNSLVVHFDEPQRAAATGQYVVFYDDDQCLGGAAIDQIHKIADKPSAIMRPPSGQAGHA